jgi:hypothetical protein
MTKFLSGPDSRIVGACLVTCPRGAAILDTPTGRLRDPPRDPDVP